MSKHRVFSWIQGVLIGCLASLFACSNEPSVEKTTQALASDDADAGPAPAPFAPFSIDSVGKPQEAVINLVFPEGPAWNAAESAVYFSDISGNAIYRLVLPSTLETVVQPSGDADGLAFDPQGKLIAAGYASRTVWRLNGGTPEVLASDYQGQKFNSPDDITSSVSGNIYFTDPTFGLASTETAELGFEGIFRIASDGSLHLEDQTISGPNGIILSPDELTLYVSSTFTGDVYAYTVQPDGSLSDKRTFASSLSGADSMCVDAAGNLYVATISGIAVLTPDGRSLGTISVPNLTSNVGFGGADHKTLFITARSIFSFLSQSPSGVLYQVENMPVPGPARGR
jgi:sugar lactone lactonase YvrE